MTVKITWQVTPSGIIAAGELAPRRTKGSPLTLQHIAASYGARLRRLAPDLQRLRMLAALVATESGGNLDPTPRYEPHCRDFSFGPIQMLTKTAAGLLGKTPHPPVLHQIFLDQHTAVAWASRDPDALAWRAQMTSPAFMDMAAEDVSHLDHGYACNGDPIMLYASYNAGHPIVALHPHDKFGLVSYVHADGSTALDSFSKFYGDACVVFPDMNTQPPPAPVAA
jgi:hypothetical protein